ncbi:hypothetical protein H9P43_000295 [Blastocladiella emersonii ATCC 22665]|nr:hypothetical protein H9P43_000277 [Blastocladiella emersonii ATCC 22665]KAI9188873.1 hypothetical protein H9P43_000295 [Blastocladiella emersonii ATCC 22665]
MMYAASLSGGTENPHVAAPPPGSAQLALKAVSETDVLNLDNAPQVSQVELFIDKIERQQANGDSGRGRGRGAGDAGAGSILVERKGNDNEVAEEEESQQPQDPDVTPAHCAFLTLLGRKNMHLHAAGVAVPADDWPLLQTLTSAVPTNVCREQPVSALEHASTHGAHLHNVLLCGFGVHARDFMRTVADNRVAGFGSRFLDAMKTLLAAYRGPDALARHGLANGDDHALVIVLWDANTVSATADQIAAIDEPWFDTHVSRIKSLTVDAEPSAALKHRVLAHVAAALGSPRPRPVILISDGTIFDGVEDTARRELGLDRLVAAAGNGSDADRWVLQVRTPLAATVIMSWAQMCLTDGPDEAKGEWRARAAAAATEASSQASKKATSKKATSKKATSKKLLSAIAAAPASAPDRVPVTRPVLEKLRGLVQFTDPEIVIPVHVLDAA